MNPTAEVLAWLEQALGPYRLLNDDSNEHPGERAATLRLSTPQGEAYLKVQGDPTMWANEAHAYQRWAAQLEGLAPRLLAVRVEPPLALVISALPGRPLAHADLEPGRERAVWFAAGQALRRLHSLPAGTWFGPSDRGGSPSPSAREDAGEYLQVELRGWLERGLRLSAFTPDELAFSRALEDLLPSFTGEGPTACHRDYCPANWLVDSEGRWLGMIDFEFSYPDVRSADFARYANWEDLRRPELPEALREGYGLERSAVVETQILFSRAAYALAAVAWGTENGYHIYANEGREAIRALSRFL